MQNPTIVFLMFPPVPGEAHPCYDQAMRHLRRLFPDESFAAALDLYNALMELLIEDPTEDRGEVWNYWVVDENYQVIKPSDLAEHLGLEEAKVRRSLLGLWAAGLFDIRDCDWAHSDGSNWIADLMPPESAFARNSDPKEMGIAPQIP